MGSWYGGFRPYVPVAQRRAQAAREVAKLAKQGQKIIPVKIEGRAIASTFWGKAWCENLEGYGDFANRLPRGRTYARNGSVVHLEIAKGRIEAFVSGSELYKIQIEIAPLAKPDWQALKQRSAGQIGSLVELLQGKLSKAVMELVTNRHDGLFPKPNEIKMRCSCPDYAGMCKHIAATMYGIGNRLDSSPELLFVLRGVDHLELIEQAIPQAPTKGKSKAPALGSDDLGALFGIEIGDAPASKPAPKPAKKPATKMQAATKPRAETKPPTTKAATKALKKPATKVAATKVPKTLAAKPASKKAVAEKPALAPKKAKAKLSPKKG
jgi:uncharacterized Zn finger protein